MKSKEPGGLIFIETVSGALKSKANRLKRVNASMDKMINSKVPELSEPMPVASIGWLSSSRFSGNLRKRLHTAILGSLPAGTKTTVCLNLRLPRADAIGDEIAHYQRIAVVLSDWG